MRVAIRSPRVWAGAVSIVGVLLATATPSEAASPTFSRDVAPIVFAKCAECHRPGSIAPMSFLTYDDARPWARAMKQKVVAREMPPWGADPRVGTFANDPSLTDSELSTLVAWVDAVAPEGNATDLPKAPAFVE